MILFAGVLAQAMPLAALPPVASAPDPCVTICDAKKLRPVFDKLARIERDRTVVRILQIGDSHTAGDQVTGAWRTALQSRYGNAGRGVLAPGRPYGGYLTKDVTAQMAGPWAIAGIFGPAYSSANPTPIGLSDFSLTGPPGASMTLSADRSDFSGFTACALAQPGAGTLLLTLGGVVRPMPLDAGQIATRCATVASDQPASTASLAITGGPVTVTSWATERAAPGVVLANLGTVGAQLVHFGRTDDRIVAAEAAQYRPDLLVVAFGTNEAFMPRFSALEYGARLRGSVTRLKRLFPGTPMLMLGAPDSATRLAALQTGESGVSPACTSGVVLPAPMPGFDTPPPGDWRPTAALASVQATQRRVAHDEGVAFWDWSRAMGGRCAAIAWSRAGLMRPDHVHFTTAGGTEIARRLQADLDAAAFTVGAR